ncbi:MAG TPA: penicillin-binding protein activator, partial [Pseudolysinimonas sp.]|nr:penicillin-binding protein activator [Pseudolysinimonas sp.]
VGFISPTTGTFAVAGQQMEDGWKFYWDQAKNKAGGVTVETTYEDDAGDVNQSLAKAKQLVEQDGVDIVVGPLIANTASAVAAYTYSQGVPNLEPVAASNNLTLSGSNDLTVRTSSMGGTQANYPGGEWAATKDGAKTAVTVCSDYSFGWESCAGFTQGFEAKGGKVVQQIWPPNGTTDFASYVSQALAAKADVIYVATAGGAPGPGFLNAYLGAGGDIHKLLFNCCAADQGTLVAMDKAGNGDKIVGLKSVSYWAEGAKNTATQDFVKKYTTATGTIPGAYIAGGYMTADLLAQVLKNKGLETGSDLVSSITSFKFADSIFGKVSWEKGNNMVGPVYVREVKRHSDGKLYNDVVADYQSVSQFLGKKPQTVIDQDKSKPYSNSFQG